MSITRPRVAQALLAAVVVAMLLPWATSNSEVFVDSRGIEGGEGTLVALVALVTMGLVQIGWRPAWFGAGLIVAITGRQLLDLADLNIASPGIGLWLGFGCALGAAALLIVEMFAGIERPEFSDTDE